MGQGAPRGVCAPRQHAASLPGRKCLGWAYYDGPLPLREAWGGVAWLWELCATFSHQDTAVVGPASTLSLAGYSVLGGSRA